MSTAGNNAFNEWLEEATTLLGLDASALEHNKDLLYLTKVVAHTKARPAAPLTAFLVGLAAANSHDVPGNIAKLLAALEDTTQDSSTTPSKGPVVNKEEMGTLDTTEGTDSGNAGQA